MKTRKKGYSAPPEQMSSVMASSSQFVRETSITGVFSETWEKVTTQKYIRESMITVIQTLYLKVLIKTWLLGIFNGQFFAI